jgi:hypothetical protein
MAEIHAEPDAVVATARLLLDLADDPGQVEFTHGPNGAMFIVPDELANHLYSVTQKPVELEEPEPVKVEPVKEPEPAPKAPVGAPPALEPKKATVNPRAKAKE